MGVGVGGEVESKCGHCHDVTWHIVVAKVGDDIVKVLCKRCDAQHRYRPPEGTKPKPRPKPERLVSDRSPHADSGSKASSARRAGRVDQPRVEADPDRPVRPYSVKELYAPGDRISHPRFGEGVVEASPGAGKVEVFFKDGRRLLAQARPERKDDLP